LATITSEVKTGLFLQNVAVKILQGGAGTQNVLGGLTVYPHVANFPYVCVRKNVEISWQ